MLKFLVSMLRRNSLLGLYWEVIQFVSLSVKPMLIGCRGFLLGRMKLFVSVPIAI